ncbi:hypothetical protein [uncultured Mesotoga sp.]|uniref:hypothetical protein n=1 Tax=uncultured Mesotoga sp. TaxID=1184400 RepID=UPI002595CB7A|nr:hypothetical protein [uncultured Mesotoga sp.]
MKKTVIFLLVLLLVATLTFAVGQQFRGNKSGQSVSEECSVFVDEDGDRVNDLCPNEGQMLRQRLRDGSCQGNKFSGKGKGHQRNLGNR